MEVLRPLYPAQTTIQRFCNNAHGILLIVRPNKEMELLALKSAQEKLSQKRYRVGTLALYGELMVAVNDVWLTVEEFQALADGTVTFDDLYRKHRG